MSNQIIVSSAVPLTSVELKKICQSLNLTPADEVINQVDGTLVAGLKITANSKTVDLTVKHQLKEIVTKA